MGFSCKCRNSCSRQHAQVCRKAKLLNKAYTLDSNCASCLSCFQHVTFQVVSGLSSRCSALHGFQSACQQLNRSELSPSRSLIQCRPTQAREHAALAWELTPAALQDKLLKPSAWVVCVSAAVRSIAKQNPKAACSFMICRPQNCDIATL